MPDEAMLSKASVDLSELGRTGLYISGGRTGHQIVTEEFLPKLSGSSGVKVYKEMRDNDPVIGAVMMAVQNLVRQAEWEVRPGGDSSEDEQNAEFVQDCIDDLNNQWSDFISEAMSMVVFGWSFFEIVYKRRAGNPRDREMGSIYDDNKIGWRKFAIRSQDTLDSWDMDRNGNVRALLQRPPPDYTLRRIPVEKAIHIRTATWKNNPEGRSLLRNAYRPWYFKKRMEEIEGIGFERELTGIPKITIPASAFRKNATPEEKETLEAAVKMGKNLRNDEQAAVIIPALYDDRGNKLFDVELMTTGGRRQFDTDGIIMRYNRTIALSMLADFVIIGHDNVGSFAMASAKTKVFATAIGSYMDTIAEQFNRFAIPNLLAVNGMNPEKYPMLVHSDIETVELDQLAQYINALSNAQVSLTDEDIREYLARQAGMPDKLEEREDGGTASPFKVPGSRGTQPTVGAEPTDGEDDNAA